MSPCENEGIHELVEHFFNKIKHYRRIATRYDKPAENSLAALKLVAVRIWHEIMRLC